MPIPPIIEFRSSSSSIPREFFSTPTNLRNWNFQSSCTCSQLPSLMHRTTLTTPSSIAYFKNVQSLGYWFIDGASEIVVQPDSEHRWLLLTLFTSVEGHPVLAGYCFLYIFTNPFTSPTYSLRLCQILILPPFQKQGHSSRIFDVVYSILLHHHPSVYLPNSYPAPTNTDEPSYFMYTVEDPCEEFTFVRDVYDCRLLQKHPVLREYLDQARSPNGPMTLKEEDKAAIRQSLGIIPAQSQKCYNILLHQLFKEVEDAKAYRLFVDIVEVCHSVDQTAACSNLSGRARTYPVSSTCFVLIYYHITTDHLEMRVYSKGH